MICEHVKFVNTLKFELVRSNLQDLLILQHGQYGNLVLMCVPVQPWWWHGYWGGGGDGGGGRDLFFWDSSGMAMVCPFTLKDECSAVSLWLCY